MVFAAIIFLFFFIKSLDQCLLEFQSLNKADDLYIKNNIYAKNQPESECNKVTAARVNSIRSAVKT